MNLNIVRITVSQQGTYNIKFVAELYIQDDLAFTAYSPITAADAVSKAMQWFIDHSDIYFDTL